ncbi:MAG: beta-lactamase family protein [Anaerolineae bacterium]|nr:beta-lactamase family protein [Anaerolineae bacterium]
MLKPARGGQSDPIAAGLRALLAEIAPADGPAVSARISSGEDTWAATGGRVDITRSAVPTPDDRFRIASMSKPFMAVTFLLLQEEGVLSLADPLTDWLPASLTGRIANGDTVTIGDLLTMTGGIPDYLDEDFFAAVLDDPARVWTAAEVLAFAFDEPALFEPGTAFDYSNSQYILLQLIAEAATGQPIHAIMRERILEPLALTNTYTQVSESLPGGFVHGYEDIDGDGVADDVTAVNDGAGLGDGGLISNTGDLVRFYQAIWEDETLLSADSRAAIVAHAAENDYGIGFEVIEDDAYGTLIGHTGGVLGFTGAVYYAVDLEAVVVILYGSTGLDEEHVQALLALAADA